MKVRIGHSSTGNAALANQGAEASTTGEIRSWAEVLVWLEYMLSALVTASRVTFAVAGGSLDTPPG